MIWSYGCSFPWLQPTVESSPPVYSSSLPIVLPRSRVLGVKWDHNAALNYSSWSVRKIDYALCLFLTLCVVHTHSPCPISLDLKFECLFVCFFWILFALLGNVSESLQFDSFHQPLMPSFRLLPYSYPFLPWFAPSITSLPSSLPILLVLLVPVPHSILFLPLRLSACPWVPLHTILIFPHTFFATPLPAPDFLPTVILIFQLILWGFRSL